MTIENEEQLRNLYGWPKGRAKDKVLSQLEKHSKNFISKSPFLVLSSYSANGKVDSSPKGGEPGFVKIIDDQTILIPDTKGNNRVDGLVNILETSNVGCLFIIPGIDESLRLNGVATISCDPKYLELFSHMRNKPFTCLRIEIKNVFLHCAKAFMRSKLWQDDYRQSRPHFPTMGKMLNDQLGTNKEESQEAMVKRYNRDL